MPRHPGDALRGSGVFDTLRALAEMVLDAASNMTVAGQNLATGALTANVGGILTARAGSRLQADGAIDVDADAATLAGTLVVGQSARLQVQKAGRSVPAAPPSSSIPAPPGG